MEEMDIYIYLYGEVWCDVCVCVLVGGVGGSEGGKVEIKSKQSQFRRMGERWRFEINRRSSASGGSFHRVHYMRGRDDNDKQRIV